MCGVFVWGLGGRGEGTRSRCFNSGYHDLVNSGYHDLVNSGYHDLVTALGHGTRY